MALTRRKLLTVAVSGGITIAIGYKFLSTKPVRLSLDNFIGEKREEQFIELFRKLRLEKPESTRGLLVQAARHGRLHKAMLEGKIPYDPKTPAYRYIRQKYSAASDVKQVDSVLSVFACATCLHNQQDFLFWHRAYLYHFEKIAQLLLRDDSFAIPYWHWDSKEIFSEPRLFSNPLAKCDTNPLCSASRDFRSSKIQPWQLRDLVMSALGANYFLASEKGDGFGQPIRQLSNKLIVSSEPSKINIEHGAHDLVHNNSGGWLKSYQSSAFDPLFWVHHCNVDRIFSKWLASEGKEWSPKDQVWDAKEWLNTAVAPFYSNNDDLVTMTRSELLDIGLTSYRYDDPSFENRLSGTLSRYQSSNEKWAESSPRKRPYQPNRDGHNYMALLNGAGGKVTGPGIGVFPLRHSADTIILDDFADHVAVHLARTRECPAMLILAGWRMTGSYESIRVFLGESDPVGDAGIDLGEIGLFQLPSDAELNQDAADLVISISVRQLVATQKILNPVIRLVSRSQGDTANLMPSLSFEKALILASQEPSK
ncbi:tyrosinase family protein [Ideonella alba]|uniref:Tyrosinase family protein n=1 Tax=Ideonella alba TaxID=2824118 RepID=A0A941BIX2_9BURK|nr:tyrosinase family protein [Ideonella alba]MBQ0933183.1 tyrosinase family protein [Ideonella alba]